MIGEPKKVYVMESGLGLVKIGCSVAPSSRAKTLSLASGVAVSVIYATAHLANARQVEAMAHETLGDCRACGEWFNVPAAEAVQAVNAAAALLGQEVQRDKTRTIIRVRLHPDLIAAVDNYYPESGNGRDWAIGALIAAGLRAETLAREAKREARR